MIPFNKPYLAGKEVHYMYQAVFNGHLSGNGEFSSKCANYFENRWGIKKCLMTTSCTDALEMSAILLGIQPGDEVIIPSYTFVSSALAFVRQGARIVFADSLSDSPNINAVSIESLITTKTKAIVVVHYAGIACDMGLIKSLAEKHNLWIVEDAAQSIDSYYSDIPLGTIGNLACFSFHETKNIQCGEGGMLAINDDRFIKRAEIIWEKGTNRAEFFRGAINKYGWVDVGSSFLPSDILAAFLYAQLESLERIQERRKEIWSKYNENLKILEENDIISLPKIPWYATNNGHMFYLVCKSLEVRQSLMNHLKENGINAVFHYLALHKSPYYINKHNGSVLTNSINFEERLLRLPFYFEIRDADIIYITEKIKEYFRF